MSEIMIIVSNNDAMLPLSAGKNDLASRAVEKVVLRVFPLQLNEAALLLAGEIGRRTSSDKCHVASGVFDTAAAVQVFTAIYPDPMVSPLTKVRVYNGERLKDRMGRRIHIPDLVDRLPADNEGCFGMHRDELCGIIADCVVDAAAAADKNGGLRCVSERDFQDKLLLHILETSYRPGRSRLLNFVQGELATWRRGELRRVVKHSLIDDYEGACQTAFERYLNAVHDEHVSPRKQRTWSALMDEVEKASSRGPVREYKADFRSSVLAEAMNFAVENRGTSVPYTFRDDVAACVEAYVDRCAIDSLYLSTSSCKETGLDEVRDRMVAKRGFCRLCADSALMQMQDNWQLQMGDSYPS